MDPLVVSVAAATLLLPLAAWLAAHLPRPAARPAELGEPERRAAALLERVLPEPELALLRRRGYLEVPSRAQPGRVYRVRGDGAPTVVLEEGERPVYLCLQPVEQLPGQESVLVHKLLLEADEAGYWHRANLVGVGPFAYRRRPG